MVDVFTSQNERKHYEEHIQKQENNKQGTADVFRRHTSNAHEVMWFKDNIFRC